MNRAAILAAMALAVMAAPALAQADDDTPRECSDGYGANLCDPSAWADLIESYQLDSAETLRAQGWRGVRVLTLSGYGGYLPIVSVLWSDAERYGAPIEDRVIVRGRYGDAHERRTGGSEREGWTSIVGAAHVLQRHVAASPERQNPSDLGARSIERDGQTIVVICGHASRTVTESLTDEGVVRRHRSGCGSDPVFDAANILAAHALNGFVHCAYLNPSHYRSAALRLHVCMGLRGENLIGAAQVAERFQSDRFIEDVEPDDVEAWRGVITDDFVFGAFQGAPATGQAGIDALLAYADSGQRANLWYERIVGRADEVEVEGVFNVQDCDELNRWYRDLSTFRQTWRLGPDGVWRLARFVIEEPRREYGDA